MIKVTVIMPSLNVAAYIDKCVTSVEKQTLSDIEILCIDAGSTDGTLDILKSHAEKDSRIRIIHSQVRSYGYQINLGIREARGEYIDVVETDDSVAYDMLDTLYMAADHQADYVKSSFYRISHMGQRIIKTENDTAASIGVETGVMIDPADYRKVHLFDSSIWAGIFRRQFLIDNDIKLNETQGAAFQDIGFAHIVLSYAHSAVYLNKPMYMYLTDRDEASTWSKNCLVYTIQEYKRLFEGNVISFDRFNANRSAIDEKMVFAVIGEITKVIRMAGGSCNDSSIIEPYEWFKHTITKEISAGFFEYDCLGKEDAAEFWMLINNIDCYADVVMAKKAVSDEKDNKLKDHIGERNVVLFGCGLYGKNALDLFINKPFICVDAITDNGKKNQGTYIRDIEVIDPDNAIGEYPNDCFVISNKRHVEDIEKQLKDSGIRAEQIMVWSNEMQTLKTVNEERTFRTQWGFPAKKVNVADLLPWSLVGWYPFKDNSQILYIGNKNDIICRMLNDKGHMVDAVKLSELEDYSDKSVKDYDYAICIKTIEKEKQPEVMIRLIHRLLGKSGILLMGMNNRYALRYICGERDPYTGHVLDGFENYTRTYARPEDEFMGRCYSGSEINNMVSKGGFKKCKLYSVLPTLENAHFLFAEDYVPNEDLANRVSPEYLYPDSIYLEEERIYDDIIKEGLFHKMADAYLAECSTDGKTASVGAVTGSVDRGEKRSVYTIIDEGKHNVTKKAMFRDGKQSLADVVVYNEDIREHGIDVVDITRNDDGSIEMPYVDAPTGQRYLKELAGRSKEEYIEAFDSFRDMILASSEIISEDKHDGMGAVLKYGYLDMVPLNSFFKDGRFVIFDQEYREENCRANVIITRMIATVYSFDPYFSYILDSKVLYDRYDLTKYLDEWIGAERRFLAKMHNEKQLTDHYCKARYNPDTVHSNRQRMDFSEEDYRRLFIDIFDEAGTRKLVLFGSGHYASNFIDVYGHDYKVSAIVDNNSERWGQNISGITVTSPEILHNMSAGEYKVIICIKNYRSVMHQLDEMGVYAYSIYEPFRCYAERDEGFDQTVTVSNDGEIKKKYHIGYISGTFDLFHLGHLNLIKKAKSQCDYLIVGVVSDEGVKEYKHVDPFIPFDERLEIVQACRYVDRAVEIPLESRGIEAAYRKYKFDCQFCGSDYLTDPAFISGKKWLEEHGSELIILPYTKSTNSTRIKTMIKKKILL